MSQAPCEVGELALGAPGDEERPLAQPVEPDAPTQLIDPARRLRCLGAVVGRADDGDVEGRHHGRPTAQDAPRVAPGDDERVHQFAVSTGVGRHQAAGHGERRLDRHPPGGDVAEHVGARLHPAWPPARRGAVVGEPALVLEPRGHLWLQQAQPGREPQGRSRRRRAQDRFHHVAVEQAALRLGTCPGHVEANAGQADRRRQGEIVLESGGLVDVERDDRAERDRQVSHRTAIGSTARRCRCAAARRGCR